MIVDVGFESMKLTKGLATHGLYRVGNVKKASKDFPKVWLLGKAKVRGDR